MELPPGPSGIQPTASTGGTLMTSLAAAAGEASALGHHSQTCDGRVRLRFGSRSVGGAPDRIQASSAPSPLPGTSHDDAGQVCILSRSAKKQQLPPSASKMKAPPQRVVASTCCLDQDSHTGNGDAHRKLAADHHPWTTSQESIRPVPYPIRYLEPASWSMPSWRPNMPSQDSHSSSHGRLLDNFTGNSTHKLPCRHMTNRVEGLDVSTRDGDASHYRVGLDPFEGSLFDCEALMQRSSLRCNRECLPADEETNVMQDVQQVLTTSSTPSIARCCPLMATSSRGYFSNLQAQRGSIQSSQRPLTDTPVSSIAHQAADQRGVLQQHPKVSSEELLPELRRPNKGAIDGWRDPSSQRVELGACLPSTSSHHIFTPLARPTLEVHGRRRFGAPQPGPSLPSPSLVPRRRRLRLPSTHVNRWQAPRHSLLLPLQEFVRMFQPGNLSPPCPPEMASLGPPGCEEPHTPGKLLDEFRRIVRPELCQAEIDQLPSYHFSSEGHEPDHIYCAVCTSNIESEELVLVLPCNHEFHATCIDKWLRGSPTCPICRWDASVAASAASETT